MVRLTKTRPSPSASMLHLHAHVELHSVGPGCDGRRVFPAELGPNMELPARAERQRKLQVLFRPITLARGGGRDRNPGIFHVDWPDERHREPSNDFEEELRTFRRLTTGYAGGVV